MMLTTIAIQSDRLAKRIEACRARLAALEEEGAMEDPSCEEWDDLVADVLELQHERRWLDVIMGATGGRGFLVYPDKPRKTS